jgi:hypothetical protein
VPGEQWEEQPMSYAVAVDQGTTQARYCIRKGSARLGRSSERVG